MLCGKKALIPICSNSKTPFLNNLLQKECKMIESANTKMFGYNILAKVQKKIRLKTKSEFFYAMQFIVHLPQTQVDEVPLLPTHTKCSSQKRWNSFVCNSLEQPQHQTPTPLP